MDNEKQNFLNEFRKNPITTRIPTKRKDDKEVVMAALKYHKYALHDASARLRDDKEVVLVAVRNNGWPLRYASERLQNDKEVVLTAVRNREEALNCASKRLKDDREVVLAAVRNYGWALNSASKRLKDDREVVLAAVRNEGWQLRYASERLRNDKEVVEAALTKYIEAVDYANIEVLPKLNLFLFNKEEHERIYASYVKKTKEEDLFLLAKAKRHFLSELWLKMDSCSRLMKKKKL